MSFSALRAAILSVILVALEVASRARLSPLGRRDKYAKTVPERARLPAAIAEGLKSPESCMSFQITSNLSELAKARVFLSVCRAENIASKFAIVIASATVSTLGSVINKLRNAGSMFGSLRICSQAAKKSDGICGARLASNSSTIFINISCANA